MTLEKVMMDSRVNMWYQMISRFVSEARFEIYVGGGRDLEHFCTIIDSARQCLRGGRNIFRFIGGF